MIKINKFFIFILALTFLVTNTFAITNEDLLKINQLVKSEKFNEAMQLINQGLEKKPNDPKLKFLAGTIKIKQNSIDEALKIFNDLIESYPDYPEPYNNLAVIYADRGEFDKAISILQKAINTNKSYSTAYINLGDLYSKKAAIAYSQVLKIDDENKIAQNKLKLIDQFFNYNPVVIEKNIQDNIDVDKKNKSNEDQVSIKNNIEVWKNSWENRDLDTYFSMYSQNFKRPENLSWSSWKKGRISRIKFKRNISIKIENLVLKNKDDFFYATFTQIYQSQKYRDESRKLLVFENINDEWKILEEVSSK